MSDNKNTKNKVLGVLGGLGPMATVYFYEMLTEHTKALTDQDHIDMVISSRASTPDRTAYITGQSEDNPLEVMTADAKRLMEFGADMIVLPCNTAHYFFDKLNETVPIPIINIIDETVMHCIRTQKKKVGILATNGTINTDTYQRKCVEHGLECEIPSADMQKLVMKLIYEDIKQGRAADMNVFRRIAGELTAKGCDTIILGCTELSLIKRAEKLGAFYTDSLEVLAYQTILACGKEPQGFDFQ